jgi:hypothetical protein
MYDQLVKCLAGRGISTFFQKPNQLVVCSTIPNDPASNSFWVTQLEGSWYLSTWLPAVYRIPDEQDVCAVCAAVLLASPTAIYTVDDQSVEAFGLERLPDGPTEVLLRELAKNSPGDEQ